MPQTVNTRIRALDFARGLAIAIMVIVHVLIVYGARSLNTSPVARAFIGLGIPTGSAPAFMFLMGASLAFSRRNSLRAAVGRGGGLLLLGFGLNAVRGIPIALYFRQHPASATDAAAYFPTSFSAAFWSADILQLAGLAVLVVALLTRVTSRPAHWLGVAALVAAVSPPLWGQGSGWPPLDRVLAFLWGDAPNIVFPLFPWLCYVLVGRAAGAWLVAAADRTAVFRRLGWAGLALLAVGLGLVLAAPGYAAGTFFRSGPGLVAGITGLVLLWIAACEWIVLRLRSSRRLFLFYAWSERAAVAYVVHWILIAWGLLLVGYRQANLGATVALMAVVLTLTHRVGAWLSRSRRPEDSSSTSSKARA